MVYVIIVIHQSFPIHNANKYINDQICMYVLLHTVLCLGTERCHEILGFLRHATNYTGRMAGLYS